VTKLTRAEREIERFRQGEKFGGRIEPFLVNSTPEPEAIEALTKALRRNDATPREQVARALVAIGRQTDSLRASGGNLIRDPKIIDILVQYGIAQHGAARDYCIEALQSLVPASLLRDYGRILSDNLKQWPDAYALLLAAKAKSPEAVPVVDSLRRDAYWAQQEQTAIAAAALGDTAVERTLTQKFLETKEPKEKMHLARSLGFVGTHSALEALAGEMRSDLIYEMPKVYFRSVRVDIMAALSFNYPDKTFLYDNAVQDDDGYARVEQFCEQEFGIKWKTPRPPYLTIQGLPSQRP
jgi:HEAT repeat protein